MTTGRIVVLNGVPRSGKSSIAQALQRRGPWINLGVDAQNRTLPPALLPGIGLRPGGERPDLEPAVVQLFLALYDAVADHARQGFDVVADVGHHDDYSQPQGILPACARRLVGLPVLFVAVHCSLPEIMRRRNADPQNGLYASGVGVPFPVQRWHDAVPGHQPHDLEVHTDQMSPADCVDRIEMALATPPRPSAFERLAAS